MNKKGAFIAVLVVGAIAFFLGRRSSTPGSDKPVATRRILYYVDPMHPSYHSDKPGTAPDCGMTLEPVYDGAGSSVEVNLPAGTLPVGAEVQQLTGVRVEAARDSAAKSWVRTSGTVEPQDSRVYRVTFGAEGWVRSVENIPEGGIVKKDGVLAVVYAGGFLYPEQNYINALGNEGSMKFQARYLRAMGMGEPQLREIAKTRQTTEEIAVTSPVDGILLSRAISPDQRFEKGMELYRIADLSKVWILADIYGADAQPLRRGASVKVTARELSKSFSAVVSSDSLSFDPVSRTRKVRLEADNPGLLLRPDMYVEVEFQAKAAPGVYIPRDAVLDSGLRKIVYVEKRKGLFEPRQIETGELHGDEVNVKRGLNAGERVATSGAFLLDSESRLRLPEGSRPGRDAAPPRQ
jgi:Cu(I)/Ag(I) efflux system membrane fusion protein